MALDTITIKLPASRLGLPTVELAGRTQTGNPRVDAVSRVEIKTVHLTEAGKQFIADMRALFSGADDEPTTAGSN